MANIPVTGLSALGSALADIGQTYQQTKRQDELMNAARARQLKDVQGERAYRDRVRGEERTARLEDNKTEMVARAQQAMIATLTMEGLLAPGEASNPDAVQSAYAQFRARGLEKLYTELTNTAGPDGAPLLRLDDFSDHAKVQAAKQALAEIKGQQLAFAQEQPRNAQATAEGLQGQLAQVRQRTQQIAAVIDQPAQQFAPDSPDVLRLAEQMAEQVKPGSGNNLAARAAMVPEAQKQLNELALMQHAQKVQSASRELESLRYNEAQLTNALRETMQTFKVAPRGGALPAALAPTGAAAAPTRAASMSDLASAVDRIARPNGEGGPAAVAAGNQALFDNPAGNPAFDVIARGNEAIQRRQQVQLQDSLGAAQKNLQDINESIATVDRPRPIPVIGPGGGFPGMLAPAPEQAARSATGLLKQKAAAEAEVRRIQALLAGPAPQVLAPATNTSIFSAPSGLGFRESDWMSAGRVQ